MIQKSYTARAGSPVSDTAKVDGLLIKQAVHEADTDYPDAEYHLAEVRMLVTGNDRAQMSGEFSIRAGTRSLGRHSSETTLETVTIPSEIAGAFAADDGSITMPWTVFEAFLEGAFKAADPELSDGAAA